MPRTALSADLHGCSRYSTLVFRASGFCTSLDFRTFVRWPRERRRAEVVEHALLAERAPGVADPPAVQDQAQREIGPLLLWDDRADVLLDLDRVLAVGQFQAIAEPIHVRVDGEAGHAESDAQDHVCRLAADPREGHQVLHPRRHLTAEALDEGPGGAQDRLGLLPEEAGRHDQPLHLGRIGGRQRGRRWPALEEQGGGLVDRLVGRLGAEDGRHQQLERVSEVQLALGRVDLLEPLDGQKGSLASPVWPSHRGTVPPVSRARLSLRAAYPPASSRLAAAATSEPEALPARRRLASFITWPKPAGPAGSMSAMTLRSSASSSAGPSCAGR